MAANVADGLVAFESLIIVMGNGDAIGSHRNFGNAYLFMRSFTSTFDLTVEKLSVYAILFYHLSTSLFYCREDDFQELRLRGLS